MRRIIIKEARPGMLLARNVPPSPAPDSPVSTDTLPAGTTLTLDHLVRLHEMGAYDLWVDDADLDFFDTLAATNITAPQQRLLDALRAAFQKLIALGVNGTDPQRPLLKRHRLLFEELFNTLIHSAPVVPCFAPMALQHEELLRHSADVCVLAALLGLNLENYLIEQRRRLPCRQARDVLNLATGCLFHDVGEVVMPVPQRESKADLAFTEGADEWKQHTGQGYAAVRTFIDPTAATIVLHHHQHFDGTGFAISDGRELTQKAGAIHIFSRIAAAADTFHHVLHPPGSVQQPTVRALARLHGDPVAGWIDPVVLRALRSLIPPFVPGMVVTLSDRQQAIVRRMNPDKPSRPEVQILRDHSTARLGAARAAPVVIDLAQVAALSITEVDGSDVSALTTRGGPPMPALSRPAFSGGASALTAARPAAAPV